MSHLAELKKHVLGITEEPRAFVFIERTGDRVHWRYSGQTTEVAALIWQINISVQQDYLKTLEPK